MWWVPPRSCRRPRLARCLSSQRSKYDAAALAVFMGSSGLGELGEWDDELGMDFDDGY